VGEIGLNTNLFGENDTPNEIYTFYKRFGNTKKYSLMVDELELLCNKYDRAECYILKGDLCKKMKRTDQTLVNYRKAIEKNTNNAAYYMILGREYVRESLFYEAIDVLTFLIENQNLMNYAYYVSYREFRLIAACSVGEWDIAEKDIDYLPDDFMIYTKPIEGSITKEILSNSIKNRARLV